MLSPNIIRAGIVVIVGGLILLALTVLAEFLVPLIGLAVLVGIGYLVYRFLTTGGLNL